MISIGEVYNKTAKRASSLANICRWDCIDYGYTVTVPVLADGGSRFPNKLSSAIPTNSDALAKQTMPCNSTDFALKLFEQSVKGKQENVLISPFSAYIALSMTANGAAGTTLDQMTQVLRVRVDDLNTLNQRNQAVLATLAQDSGSGLQIDIANAIFADSSTPFKHSFIDLCKQRYGAEVRSANFGDPHLISEINSWCSNKTQGKINSIVEKFDPDEAILLLNALYFKGKWDSPFIANETKPDHFTALSGRQQPVHMMHQSAQFLYLRGENFQAVALPYAGLHQHMYIFLPNFAPKSGAKPGKALAALQSKLQSENWKEWLWKFSMTKVDLSLPKFKIEYSQALQESLKAIGIKDAFTREVANFSKLVPSECSAWITRVQQKTYMEVDEQGTEAAAVTGPSLAATCAPIEPPPVEFRVDHPFVLAIVDTDTSEILFLGSIVTI